MTARVRPSGPRFPGLVGVYDGVWFTDDHATEEAALAAYAAGERLTVVELWDRRRARDTRRVVYDASAWTEADERDYSAMLDAEERDNRDVYPGPRDNGRVNYG